jgi:hypothetical protein
MNILGSPVLLGNQYKVTLDGASQLLINNESQIELQQGYQYYFDLSDSSLIDYGFYPELVSEQTGIYVEIDRSFESPGEAGAFMNVIWDTNDLFPDGEIWHLQDANADSGSPIKAATIRINDSTTAEGLPIEIMEMEKKRSSSNKTTPSFNRFCQ